MVRIFTRKKEKAIVQYVHVIVLTLLLVNNVFGVDEEETWGKCWKDRDIQHKRHLQIGSPHNITIEMSSRLTHQLSTHIYRILLQEELGYVQVKILNIDDYDVETIAKRLNCIEQQDDGNIKDIVPESMINLEVPLLPDFSSSNIDTQTCVKELGTITPPGYFGWFMPLELSQNIKKYSKDWPSDSMNIPWTLFREAKFTKYFQVDDKDFKTIIQDSIYNNKTAKTYHCNESRCSNGWFIPEWCDSSCGVLLAPDYKTTKFVIDHIIEMKVYIKVVWLGDNLERISGELTRSLQSKRIYKSFIILSWTPSDLIFDLTKFISVTMKRCDVSSNGTTSGCFYEKRRIVKYAWRDLQHDQRAFNLLSQINFMEKENYLELLNLYERKRTAMSIPDIACEWLKNQTHVWREWLPVVEKVLNIGGIFPISGSTYIGRGIVKGANMATDAINRNKTILPNYKLQLLVADGQCRADRVMKAFIDYLTQEIHSNLVGVLGPACSETVEPLAGLSKYYKTIIISYSAEGSFFSDRDKYPYVLRTNGENKHYKYVYLALLKELKWKRVAALTEDGQKYTEYISHMQDVLEANHINFISNTKFPRDREKDAMYRYLDDLKRKRAKIIIADVFDEIARNVMCEAYKLGMTAKHGYVWFLPTWLNKTWYDTTYFNQYRNESVNCTTANMIEAVNGYFAMSHAFYANNNDIMQENMSVGEWRKKYEAQSAGVTSDYAGYAYDAVWAYALALNKLIKEDPNAIFDLHSTNVTNKLTNIIKHLDFNGVSGKIKFRGGATRFSVINILQWYNNETKIIGRFYPNISENAPEILGGRLELNKNAITWLGNKIPDDGTLPPEECTLNSLAKFLNVKCEMAIIILNILIILCLIVLVVVIIFVIKKGYDKRMMNTEKYMKSLGLHHLLTNDYTGLDKWEIERECVVLNRKLGEGAFGTVYGGEASFASRDWTPVAVKTLKIGSTTEEKLDFLSEAEVMKRFDHKNIIKLLGVCTKVEPVYTVMEFMLYGDLKTYLLARRHLVNGNNVDEYEEVSSKRLTAMALDVARGLSYLAELKYVHRDVASRNCLINEARVVKLGDFGMTRPMFENDYYKFNRRGMLPVRWMAPESLGLGVFTPSSDVWSYGVLVYEIITFGSFPFQGMTNSQVLDYVKAGNTLTIPQGVKPPLEFLLKTCWHPDPKLRPTASEMVEYLANNSRLISPCLDVPISSVQMEDTGQLEMQLPDTFRKCSSSLSFKNLPLMNGMSSMSIHTPTRKVPPPTTTPTDNAGNSIQMENCCPKEPLLPPRSDSLSECGKYVCIQHSSDSGYHQEPDEEMIPNSVFNGHGVSKV